MQLSAILKYMTKMHIHYLGNHHTECQHQSGAIIETDAPKESGGKGEAFCPTDLFATSLGACMLTLMSLTAKKMGIELKGMKAEVEKEMITSPKRRVGKIIVRIQSSYSPNSDEQKKLEEAAIGCPVHLSMHPDIKIAFDFVWGL